VGPILASILQEVPLNGAELLDEPATSNPILPTGNELFWAAVTFFLLWALMKWVLLPPVMKAMKARADKVSEDLGTAEATKAEAAAELAAYEESLLGAKAEAVRIVEDARSQAEAQRQQVTAAAEAEVAAQRAAAAAEIAEAKERAKAELQTSLAGIAVDAAEAVIQRQLDRDAQTRVIEDYVNRAGSQN
jgi:F-type H+-transporting ATPase subunit b